MPRSLPRRLESLERVAADSARKLLPDWVALAMIERLVRRAGPLLPPAVAAAWERYAAAREVVRAAGAAVPTSYRPGLPDSARAACWVGYDAPEMAEVRVELIHALADWCRELGLAPTGPHEAASGGRTLHPGSLPRPTGRLAPPTAKSSKPAAIDSTNR